MWYPVFNPHNTGGALAPGTVTVKVSVMQVPILVPDGGMVFSVEVSGLVSWNASKSSLSWQTSELLLQTVMEQADPAAMAELVKYVQFSAMLPEPQDFSKTQQTPNPDAQVPLELPLLEEHSELV